MVITGEKQKLNSQKMLPTVVVTGDPGGSRRSRIHLQSALAKPLVRKHFNSVIGIGKKLTNVTASLFTLRTCLEEGLTCDPIYSITLII